MKKLRLALRFRGKVHKSVLDDNIVEVSEVDGVRSLHLGSNTVQSSMKLRDTFSLELAYTRGMMCFLLFSETIKHVLTIGLGGGSCAKYMLQNCPEINQTVIEINPQIISIAHSHFYVPQSDEKLNIIEGDGLVYLINNINSADCLMIDAFDAHGIPADFCSQDFFDSCEMALTEQGIFAINLWGSDKNFDVYLQRIESSFNGRALILPTGKPGNIVVFGFKFSANLKKDILLARAKALEKNHKIEFERFLEKLCDHNPHNHKQLFWHGHDITP